MAKFWLINSVTVAGITMHPGDEVDDAIEDTAPLLAAGALLWPQGNATVDAAAAVARNAHINRGANEQELSLIMTSAVDSVQLAEDTALPETRTLTAGAGLTGGGDLSADRTFDVVGNPDGSIVANANDVQVGVLASDAQHGIRGGGTQHAAAFNPSTTIASGSDTAALPQATINVASTTNFASSGTIFVNTSNGRQAVTYTGVTSTTFTGCTGGTGTMSTGGVVVGQTPVTGFLSATDKRHVDDVVNTCVADWPAAAARFFAVDYDGGSDSNAGFSDVSGAAAGLVAKKTFKGLETILPKNGAGRKAVVMIKARTSGYVAGVSRSDNYKNEAGLDTLFGEPGGNFVFTGGTAVFDQISDYRALFVRGTSSTPDGVIAFLHNTADKQCSGGQIMPGTSATGYRITAVSGIVGTLNSANTFTFVKNDEPGSPPDLTTIGEEPFLIMKRIRFGNQAVATTTIAVASNGLSLPQATINVVSTAGFSATGATISVVTGAGLQFVSYTGLTGTSFTGCTGGTGLMSTGGAVAAPYRTANSGNRGSGACIVAYTANTITLAKNANGGALSIGDTFFIEEPGVAILRMQPLVVGGDTVSTNLGQIFHNGLTMCGFRLTGQPSFVTGENHTILMRSGSCSFGFIESINAARIDSVLIDQVKYVSFKESIKDENNATFRVGMGWRGPGMRLTGCQVAFVQSAGAVGEITYESSETFSAGFQINDCDMFQVGVGCYSKTGVDVYTSGAAGPMLDPLAGFRPMRMIGARPNASGLAQNYNNCQPFRIEGAVGNTLKGPSFGLGRLLNDTLGGGITVTGAAVTILGCTINNCGSAPAISIENVDAPVYIQNVTGSTGNMSVGISTKLAVNSAVILSSTPLYRTAFAPGTISNQNNRSDLVPPTVTGALGDIETAGPIYYNYSSLAYAAIQDKRGNRILGAGDALSNQPVLSPVSSTVSKYDIAKNAGTGVAPAVADSLANASKILGITQSGATASNSVMLATSGQAWVEFSNCAGATVTSAAAPVYPVPGFTGETITSAVGTYPTLFTLGQSFTIRVGSTFTRVRPFGDIGDNADQTQAQILNNINRFFDFDSPGRFLIATAETATTIKLTSRYGEIETVSGTAAVFGTPGTYPTGFVGGETLTLGQDVSADFIVTFTAADQSRDQVIQRINAASSAALGGYEMAVRTRWGLNATPTLPPTNLNLISSLGDLRVVGASSAGVLTTLGITTGTRTNALTRLGFTAGAISASNTLVLGTGTNDNFTVPFGSASQTRDLVIARINRAAGFTMATPDADPAKIILTSYNGDLRVVSGSAGVLAALGLTAATTVGTGFSVGDMAYLSTTVAGKAQAFLPPVNATDQKLRIGRVLRTALDAPYGLVGWNPDALPVLADGLA